MSGTRTFRFQPLGKDFELGPHQPLIVREEVLRTHPEACRVAYISDIHLRRGRSRGFDLVLAGHLHGCQVVAFEAWGRLVPGALFYPHNHLRQSFGESHLRVAMGCSDLIPIRWGCPREILVCIL